MPKENGEEAMSFKDLLMYVGGKKYPVKIEVYEYIESLQQQLDVAVELVKSQPISCCNNREGCVLKDSSITHARYALCQWCAKRKAFLKKMEAK